MSDISIFKLHNQEVVQVAQSHMAGIESSWPQAKYTYPTIYIHIIGL